MLSSHSSLKLMPKTISTHHNTMLTEISPPLANKHLALTNWNPKISMKRTLTKKGLLPLASSLFICSSNQKTAPGVLPRSRDCWSLEWPSWEPPWLPHRATWRWGRWVASVRPDKMEKLGQGNKEGSVEVEVQVKWRSLILSDLYNSSSYQSILCQANSCTALKLPIHWTGLVFVLVILHLRRPEQVEAQRGFETQKTM